MQEPPSCDSIRGQSHLDVLPIHAVGHIDARVFQICALSTLLAIQMLVFDFGATVFQLGLTVLACVLTQLCFGLIKTKPIDFKSAVITGISLTLLLRSNDPAVWVLAAALGIASKFLFTFHGKHLFNPACFAIVSLLLTSQAWISPGIWGSVTSFAVVLICLGGMVLLRAARVDTAVAFLTFTSVLLLLRAFTLGDPLAIPLHQIQSGSFLIFSLFMITDPRSTPNSRQGRIAFAAAVALLAYYLQFEWQLREGMFYALVLAAPLTPIIDQWRPGRGFNWSSTKEA